MFSMPLLVRQVFRWNQPVRLRLLSMLHDRPPKSILLRKGETKGDCQARIYEKKAQEIRERGRKPGEREKTRALRRAGSD